MSTDLTYETTRNEQLQYRAICSTAVVSLILGLLSVLTIPTANSSVEACLVVCPIPLFGIALAIRSLVVIRRLPDEMTGSGFAITGLTLSVVFLVGGLGLATYVYATEVPEGYSRVAFSQMRPSETEKKNGVVVPPDLMAYNGEKVFIKGYMRPPSQKVQISEFLLVRDNNECCFGINLPEYFDQIRVHLVSGKRVNYSTRLFRMGGTLRAHPVRMRPESGQSVYTLIADYVK